MFHDGELTVQRRAGVEDEAQRLVGMLGPANLNGGARHFLAERELALISARDGEGHLWISPLSGPQGFLDGHDATLNVYATPEEGDPLAGLAAGQPIGLLAIDFAIRRRLRINGTLSVAAKREMEIEVDQAYGNCPKYIHKRELRYQPFTVPPEVRIGTAIDAEQVALIQRAGTFFLGTIHPQRGADASHRGGPPGFVRVDGGDLYWPDYPGNNMFNSFGNLAVDDTAALLFIDFVTGVSLYLSGRATVEWSTPGVEAFDTGRLVRFRPQHVVESH